MISRVVAGLIVALGMAACAPTVMAPGPPVQIPRLNADHFIAADGAQLPVRSWRPETAPQAVLIALHGFNDYGAFFEEPATWLAAQGILSYAPDQRGFGAAPHAGFWAGTRAYAADLRALIKVVRDRHPQIPLFVLGESMGGAVALATLTGPEPLPVAGYILAAPAVWGRSTMPWYQRLSLALSAHSMPGLKLSGRNLKITPSDNREMLIALGRDPLVIKETRVDAIYGLVNLMDLALAAAPQAHGPMLILYGARDEIIRREPMQAFLNKIPTGRQIIAVEYDQGFHMVLRDLQAATVWADIAAWIKYPERPVPSGAQKIFPAK